MISGSTFVQFLRIAAVVAIVAVPSWAMPGVGGSHHSFMGGPWEIMITSDADSREICFPVVVSEESKLTTLDSVFPVMGTPIEIKLKQYVPDLKWQTSVVENEGGGVIWKLNIKGPNMDQEMWLDSDDPAKRSMSSSIGGVAIKTFKDARVVKELVKKLAASKAVGVVSVGAEDSDSQMEFVVGPEETIAILNSAYKLSVLEYMPNYSVDTETRKVVNRSDEPLNPAIKVRLTDGSNIYERWLWSKISSPPHGQAKLPFNIEFHDFDLSNTQGRYVLVVARGSQPWLLFSEEGKVRVEKPVIDKSYPFADKEYYFNSGKIVDGATIEVDWNNNSENLLRPAIIASVGYNGLEKDVVLELNKPCKYQTGSGYISFLYRCQTMNSK